VPSTIGRDHLIQPVGWKRAVIIVLPKSPTFNIGREPLKS
jgi:hypothetical protein